MSFVRFGLEPLVRSLRSAFRAAGPWEKSSEYYILREVYRPLEFLFTVAAVTTLAENFLPQLIALPKAMVQNVVRSTLSLTFVLAAARVVFNVKARVTRESTWKLELSGDLTKQRRVEAVDKLFSVLFLIVTGVLGLQAIGLDVNSVLAIGGVGGLAVGLAGREILENLFTGLIILSSSPFEVGDEVQFTPPNGAVVEGIVIDVGWYRTTIRSFEREVFCIPNSVFSRNVVLNITRKQREWRFFERVGLRVDDAPRAGAVVADMRKVLRADPRIIQKLHRRVFLDKVDRDQATVYVSFYVEAANRDAFMAIKQDLLLAFVDCVEKNGARLARNRLQIAIEAAPVRGSGAPGSGGRGGGGGGPGGAFLALPGDALDDGDAAAAAATSTAPPPAVDVTSNVVPAAGAAAGAAAAKAVPADALRAAVAAAAGAGGEVIADGVLTRTLDGGDVWNASFDDV
jgi:MscS family membrane protein